MLLLIYVQLCGNPVFASQMINLLVVATRNEGRHDSQQVQKIKMLMECQNGLLLVFPVFCCWLSQL